MLGGDDDGVDALRLAELVLNRHLGLAVGPQVGKDAFFADLREALAEVVGEVDRKGHKLRRLVAGEAHHDPLIASALV